MRERLGSRIALARAGAAEGAARERDLTLRIAFVGLPIAALLLARDGHEMVGAGVCREGARGTRRRAQSSLA